MYYKCIVVLCDVPGAEVGSEGEPPVLGELTPDDLVGHEVVRSQGAVDAILVLFRAGLGVCLQAGGHQEEDYLCVQEGCKDVLYYH